MSARKGTALVAGLAFALAVVPSCRRREPPAPVWQPPSHPPPTPPNPPLAQLAWRAALEAEGLAQYAPALRELVRPAVSLRTRSVRAADLAIGQSRVGGVPDLPARFAWPSYQGKHLAFVAQIDLREVARAMPDGPLPQEGQLWFFYAWDQTHWGFDPKDA